MHSVDDAETKTGNITAKYVTIRVTENLRGATSPAVKHRRNAETAYGKSQNAQKNMRTGLAVLVDANTTIFRV